MSAVLPDIVKEGAHRHADRTALAAGSHRVSYAELDAWVDSIAVTLQEIDVRGRRVGLLLPNHLAFPALLHGILRAGGTAVMMNPQYSPREAREVIADAELAGVITATPLLPLLPADARAILIDEFPRQLRVRDAAEEWALPLGRGRPDAVPADPDAEAVIVFTAAVGGRARGARLSHGNLLANSRSTVEAMQKSPNDRVAGILPFIHLFGQTVTMNAPLSLGACIHPIERFNPVRVLEMLEQEQITVICGVPGIFGALLHAAARRGAPDHSLRVAICGGSPLPLEIGRRWEEVFGLSLREGYGLTEASPVCLFNRIDRPNHPGTMGYPFPGVEVTIRDATGAELPDGEVGEICVRGENVFLGYLGEDGRNPSDFHGEWLRTGDLGTIEGEGVIRYRGLLKSMFTRNGFNVYPAEVARVLEEDRRIRSVRVCALPDPIKENEIVLFLELAPGASLTEDEVREMCRQRLAVFKQPARIVFESQPAAAAAD